MREEKPYHGHDGFGDADPSTLPAVDDDYKLEEEIAQLALIRLAREHKGRSMRLCHNFHPLTITMRNQLRHLINSQER